MSVVYQVLNKWQQLLHSIYIYFFFGIIIFFKRVLGKSDQVIVIAKQESHHGQ